MIHSHQSIIYLLLQMHGLTSISVLSALTPPSECDELRLENLRLRALLERFSARCREQPEFEPRRLSEERHGIRVTARALLQAEDAAVVRGEANTNECPVGSAAMSSAEECEQAADILGIDFSDIFPSPDLPKACYLYGGLIFFNTHPIGSAEPISRPICYAQTSVPTPAPTRIGDTISLTAVPTMKGAARLCRRLGCAAGVMHPTRRCICADRCNGTLRMALSSEPVPLTDGSGRYKRNMRCEWQLSGSGTIELVMLSMDLEDETDTLKVFDGPNSSSLLLAELSGVASDPPDPPEPIQSSGGSMTVVFTSDEAGQREGFVGAVRSVPAATPSPTVVGHTWAPTTAAPTGPCHMHRATGRKRRAPTRCVVDRR
jgi:hypothetical protein